MSTFIKKSFLFSLLFLGILSLINVGKAQPLVDPPTDIGGTSGMIAPNAFSLCVGSPLTLTANCGTSSAIFPVWPDRNRTYDITVEPGLNVYDVYCSDEVNDSAPVSVSVIGGCVDFCNLPSSATNFQAVGNLNGENCSIQLSALVTGKHFEFTGPNGYVFSHVFRYCQENIEILAKDVKQPGVYTLKVYTNAPVPRAVRGEELPEEPFITYTLEVGGTACHNPR